MSSEDRVTRRELMTAAGAIGVGALATAAHAAETKDGAGPAHPAAMAGVQYQLLFVNDSQNNGDACVYQTDPDLGVANAMSLAWFSKRAFPTTKILFTWTIDYSFTWADTGELIPGVYYLASQSWPADLTTSNQVSFDKISDAYTFLDQKSASPAGSLVIKELKGIPRDDASVGIGMSGAGTFAVQAQSNWNLVFTPHPKYWITFGTFTPGEVLDVESISNPAEIAFPPNVYSMTAVLNADNTWTVSQTKAYNRTLRRQKAAKKGVR